MLRFAPISLFVLLIATVFLIVRNYGEFGLSDHEKEIIFDLSLASLQDVPTDPSNHVANNPKAAAFGKLLFNDTDLSMDGKTACSSCHIKDQQFQDGIPLGRAIGVTTRRTMPLRGVAYSTWFFWDGRKDSLWSQALGPIESPVEHGFTRSQVVNVVQEKYPNQYAEIFEILPNMKPLPAASPIGSNSQRMNWQNLSAQQRQSINRIFANTGKAIAAFEQTLLPNPSRFDVYAQEIRNEAPRGATSQFTDAERRGLKIFIGKGQCVNCHNGPLFTDNFFHNTGIPSTAHPVKDFGRKSIIRILEGDPFNCLGAFSDAPPDGCKDLKFMSRDPHAFDRAFKTPGLRGVARRAPYMHAGQIETLADVIEHYNQAPTAPSGHSELRPLHLNSDEKSALLAFLKTL